MLDEAYTLLLHRAGHHVAVELGEDIRASRLVTVIRITLVHIQQTFLGMA